MMDFDPDICIDCDRREIDCVCESRARCSCGVPILVCPCAYGETAGTFVDTTGEIEYGADMSYSTRKEVEEVEHTLGTEANNRTIAECEAEEAEKIRKWGGAQTGRMSCAEPNLSTVR